MPTLFPAPKPRLSCSIRRVSGNFWRTRSGVPSVDALSTTITSAFVPRRLPSELSIHGAASCVTTTALTSASTIGFARDPRTATRPAQALPGEDRRPRGRQQDREHEEEESGGERLVGADAELAEEADEERLAHGESVDRERDQHHEEEERAHHVVRARRKIDPDRLAAQPDGQHAHRLNTERDREDDEEHADVVPVRVDGVVDPRDELVEPSPRQHRATELEQRPRTAREEQEAEDDCRDNEERLDPEVRADVVVADREQEADRGQDERRRPADRPLEEHRRRGGVAVARMASSRLVDANGVSADGRRQDLPRGVRHEVRPRQPGNGVVDALCPEQELPAPGHRQNGQQHQREREREVPRIRVRDHPQRLAEVDLPDQVGETEPRDEERQRDAQRTLHLVREECTRPSAAITSAMSSSECAGESGSDRISAPARSATGSGGWSGRSSRYAVSLCTGRKWMLVAMFSSARSRWYSSRVPPARSASIRMTYRWWACVSRGSRASGSNPSSSA